jgi:hypothetical protein
VRRKLPARRDEEESLAVPIGCVATALMNLNAQHVELDLPLVKRDDQFIST